jgi:hypothetical protein
MTYYVSRKETTWKDQKGNVAESVGSQHESNVAMNAWLLLVNIARDPETRRRRRRCRR